MINIFYQEQASGCFPTTTTQIESMKMTIIFSLNLYVHDFMACAYCYLLMTQKRIAKCQRIMGGKIA